MKSLIAKNYVEWLMKRAERVFFVYGMRRSGNHACIGWLINALEGQETAMQVSNTHVNFSFSDSGKTVFINDVSGMGSTAYVSSVNHYRKRLRNARFIVISVEDQAACYEDGWRVPNRCEVIHAQRSTLNLMASRYQNLNRRAREGLGANLQSMQSKFFHVLKTNAKTLRGEIWEFERWCDDEEWRRNFLEKLGLETDIAPPMSPPGLGSSFSGTKGRPSAEQLGKRYMTVEPHSAWVSFIRESASNHPEIFSVREHEAIRAFTETNS